MIICPNCKEEIDDDANYCDQCGQALLFCENCGRVGKGRRCTFCGGLMVSRENKKDGLTSGDSLNTTTGMTAHMSQTFSIDTMRPTVHLPNETSSTPQLVLYNGNLNIRILAYNGAILGRRQGSFREFFANNKYVSGLHAQLTFNSSTGWCVVDKHSSNGTKINNRPIQPDMPMTLHDGDILSLANVNLQISVR
jgi:hypothetical protein